MRCEWGGAGNRVAWDRLVLVVLYASMMVYVYLYLPSSWLVFITFGGLVGELTSKLFFIFSNLSSARLNYLFQNK